MENIKKNKQYLFFYQTIIGKDGKPVFTEGLKYMIKKENPNTYISTSNIGRNEINKNLENITYKIGEVVN